jgi:hypothetical protein
MRWLRAGAVLAALAVAAPVSAQSRAGYFVGAGVLSPSGDFGDFAKGGWMGAAGLSIPLGQSRWTLEPTLFYGHAAHEGSDGDASNVPGAAIGFNYALATGGVVPYVTAMSGMLQHRFDAGNTGPELGADTQVLLGAGAGIGFALGGTLLVLDARYVHAENTRFMTYALGLGFGRRRYRNQQ